MADNLSDPLMREGVQLVGFDGRPLEERDRNGCLSHCLAFLIGCPSSDVPNFYRQLAETDPLSVDTGKQFELARAWLAARGLGLITIPSPGNLNVIKANLTTLNPGQPYILGGMSADTVNNGAADHHAVVCLDGAVVCDPGGHGVGGPQLDGFYWIMYLTYSPAPATRVGGV